MPLPEVEIDITGPINRRDPRDKLKKGEVLFRENMLIEGLTEGARRCKKMPGSDRYSATDLGGTYTSGYRYYNGNIGKTFAFNDYTKKIYFIDENGNETLCQHLPSPGYVAIPCWEEMKISDNNMLYVADGFNGMYSHDGNPGQVFQKESSVTLNFVDMVTHLDRMFAFEEDSDAGYFSVNLIPTNYTDSTDAGVFLIGSKRGSRLMRVIKFQNTIYWFKDDSIWVLEGTTPSTFSLREVVPNLGLAARWGLCVTPTAIFFVGSDFEVYKFAGTLESLTLMTFKVALGGDKTKDLNEIINKDRMSQVRACYHNFLVRMSMVETGQTTNNLEYIINTTNDIDAFTRDNNVSCYIVYDKFIDQGKLVTGRSDAGVGRLMYQYRGLNYDNQATSPVMPIKLLSGFIKPNKIDNVRFKRIYGDFQVLGAEPLTVDYYLDTRLAKSSSRPVSMAIDGEYKSLTSFIRTQNQSSVTSRGILKWAYAKGQSIACGFDFSRNNIDLSLSQFTVEVIAKNRKRSEKVGV